MATDSQPCSFSSWSNDATEVHRAHDRHRLANKDLDSAQDWNHTPREHDSDPSVSDASQKDPSHFDPRKALGLHPKAPLNEDEDMAERRELRWSRVRAILREPFVEFWGVVIMVVFGNGATAQVLLSTKEPTAPGGNGYGSYQNINWG
jgi:aquaglyceroporin related protein